MKLLLVLCALIAVAAASYGNNANTFNSPSATYLRPRYVNDIFDTPRHHRRHRGGRHGRHGRHWDSSDSDSDSDSSSGSYERDYWFQGRPFFFPQQFGGNVAQDSAASYGSASNDAPASSVYGSASNDAPTYTANDAPASSYGRK